MESQPPEFHIHKLLTESQAKYTYFLLAAAASGVALAVNRTTGSTLEASQWPLGLAVLAWGLSFFFGCRHLGYHLATLFANAEYFRVRKGVHPDAGSHPQVIQAASEGILQAMERNSRAANRLGHWQFRYLIAGALFFLLWHVLVMASTPPSAPGG